MSLAIQYLPLSTLADRFLKGNAKLHDIGKISDSIQRYGFRDPLALDATLNNGSGGIVEGNGRLEALIKLRTMGASVPRFLVEVDGGDWAVPVVVGADSQTESEGKAYSIDHNLVGMFGADFTALDMSSLFDEGAYLSMLEELAEAEDLPLSVDADDLALLLDQLEDITELDPDALDEVPPHEEADTLTKEGDVWILGRHRLMCGDSTSIDAVEKLMNGRGVDCVYTDPPYGISIVRGGKIGGDSPFGSKGSVGGGKLAKTGNYAPVANDDSIDVAVSAIDLIATLGAKVEIIWGGNYYAASLPNSPCWIVWDKKNTGNFADCELAWTNQKTAVRKFEHMWNGMLRASERDQKRVHPTQKPVALAEWCLENYAEECTTVLDLFGGSGSTLLACEALGKDGFVMELASAYVDVIIKRWQNLTGQSATLEATGQTYSELEAEKLGE